MSSANELSSPGTEAGFQVIEPWWIELDHGVGLAARLWLPDAATEQTPVGAVVEYLPYRARDLTRSDDDATGTRLAAHGFAFVRVDIRGTGESGGVIHDEFEESQTDDLVGVIDWLAGQPWCNGSVGVRGYSWGGNAALYAAARNPKPLKAVVACCSCGDRFARDLHWHGGALGLTNINWAAYYNTVVGLPPDPAVAGESWRNQWKQRLEAINNTAATWTDHQRADAYWEISSPAHGYGDISVPVYAVGGQLDGFVDEVDQLLSHVKGPKKGLVGPWGHSFPHNGVPGPRIDWLAEEVRWWQRWLADGEPEVMAEPMARVFVQDVAPVQAAGDLPGQWVSADAWPPKEVGVEDFWLGAGVLGAEPDAPQRLVVPDSGLVGVRWREWSAPDKGAADMPGDQAADDDRSLVFDSPVLTTDLAIVGAPRLAVRIAADQPVATLGVRLTEVDADGGSWPVSFGVANLTHRDGAARPSELENGVFYDVEVALRFAARRINAGSRLRLSLSNSLWPMVAAAPRPVQLAVETGPCSVLHLPAHREVPPRTVGETQPESARGDESTTVTETVRPGGKIQVVKHTVPARSAIEAVGVETVYEDRCVMEGDDSTSYWSTQVVRELKWPGKHVSVTSICEMTTTAETYRITEKLSATEDGAPFFSRQSTVDVPRVLS